MTAPALFPSPFNSMTALGEALVRRLTAAFATFRLVSDHPEPLPEAIEGSAVTIYLGSIKSRTRAADATEDAPKFPMVLVRPRTLTDDSGEGGAQQSIVDVDFVIGARRIGNEGFLDVDAIAARIRRDLLVTPLIESRARLELPLESMIGEDEAFPQWFGIVSARFNIPQPIEESAND